MWDGRPSDTENDRGPGIWEAPCPAGTAHSCICSFTQCSLSRTERRADQGSQAARARLRGARWARRRRADSHTFRSAVVRVALAVPVGEVGKDPLPLLRLPHQRKGLEEGSGEQFKDAECLLESMSQSGSSYRVGAHPMYITHTCQRGLRLQHPRSGPRETPWPPGQLPECRNQGVWQALEFQPSLPSRALLGVGRGQVVKNKDR